MSDADLFYIKAMAEEALEGNWYYVIPCVTAAEVAKRLIGEAVTEAVRKERTKFIEARLVASDPLKRLRENSRKWLPSNNRESHVPLSLTEQIVIELQGRVDFLEAEIARHVNWKVSDDDIFNCPNCTDMFFCPSHEAAR